MKYSSELLSIASIEAILNVFPKTISTLVTLFRLYLDQLWIHLSVVRQASGQQLWSNKVLPYQSDPTSPPAINQTYLYTFMLYCIVAIHGTIGLHLEAGQPLTFSSLRASPYLFFRQFFYLYTIWPQMDIHLVIVILGSAVGLLDFTLKRPINWRYLFTIHRNETVKLGGIALNICETAQFMTMFSRAKIIYKFFGSLFFIPIMFHSYGTVFFVTKIYSISFFSFSFWFIGWPFCAGVEIWILIVNLIHVTICASCIQIRQQYLCGQFTRLLARLTRCQANRRQLVCIWPQYLALNRTALSICRQLQAFNTFYTNYLTVVFLKYTIVQVLMAYIVFFGSSTSLAMLAIRFIFTVCILQMTTLLFGLIQFCARVVKRNGQIGKLNRRFAVHCLQHQGRYQLRVGQLLKMETLQWPRLLAFYAFKLFGHACITSRTFYAMAINISGFFLYVTKRM